MAKSRCSSIVVSVPVSSDSALACCVFSCHFGSESRRVETARSPHLYTPHIWKCISSSGGSSSNSSSSTPKMATAIHPISA
ncbi:hypothetical protein M0802_006436 [Mischocyttarus mexicanus]|nr:hypothetical protein M0802_006436 [Mischocyttarus mexicanus]